MKKILKLNVCIAIVLLIMSVEQIYAQDKVIPKLLFGFSDSEGSINHKRVVMLLAELKKREVVDIELVTVPKIRSLVMSNKGQTDGEIHRVKSLSKNPKYPNLRIVEGPWIEASLQTIIKNGSGIKVDGWESIKDHLFCYKRGILFIEKKIKEYGLTNVTGLSNQTQALKQISLGRCDVTTFWYEFYDPEQLEIIKNNGLIATHNLITINGYIYLHKSRELLIPSLKAAMEQMEKDGTRKRIFEASLK
jgi:polar amino acid transport system substrate-binding protein